MRVLSAIPILMLSWAAMPGALAQSGDRAKPAQPIVRIPPIMPAKIKRSGKCEVRYDVTPQGLTENVEVVRCTEPMFARGSMKSVSKWRYAPSDGGAARRRDEN